jgi:capsular exopolysaccharide synthesis family protein
MGNVYEALNRYDTERRGSQAAASGIDAENQQEAAEENGDRADLVSYALNALVARELNRFNGQQTTEALVPQPLPPKALPPPPVRHVEVDPERMDRNLSAFQLSDSGATEYCKLALGIIAAAEVRQFKRVLITSAQRGEGRTSVALNLACALSAARKRVLVVDTDLHNPSVLRLLGIHTEAGLAEVLARGLSVGEAIVRVTPCNLDVLPTRSTVSNPVQLLSSTGFRDLLDTLDLNYDFILFDSSPLLTTDDAKIVSRLTAATLLVIRAGKTSSAQMARAILPLRQEDLVGVVLNRARR